MPTAWSFPPQGSFLILAILLALLSFMSFVSSLVAARRKKLFGSAAGGTIALLLFVMALLFGTLSVGLRGYEALTHEAVAAVVTTTPIADQQFEVGKQIIAVGLIPIIEPEVDIHCPDKAEAENLLHVAIMEHLNSLGSDDLVMLKLTLPEQDNLYADCIAHPNVVRVVALSGGYSREEANDRLSRNNGMVASFSRALSEGLSAQQTEEEFDAMLDASIGAITAASST